MTRNKNLCKSVQSVVAKSRIIRPPRGSSQAGRTVLRAATLRCAMVAISVFKKNWNFEIRNPKSEISLPHEIYPNPHPRRYPD